MVEREALEGLSSRGTLEVGRELLEFISENGKWPGPSGSTQCWTDEDPRWAPSWSDTAALAPLSPVT